MALKLIPVEWREDVSRILQTGAPNTVKPAHDCLNRFQGSFPDAWPYEVHAAIRAFLRSPFPHGCPIRMAHPPGVTWEFLFLFRHQITYGKILLRHDRRHLVLLSAHLPDKEKLSCE